MERGLKVTITAIDSTTARAKGNIFFLEHMVLPLYMGIA
jgi:hypothetical protein